MQFSSGVLGVVHTADAQAQLEAPALVSADGSFDPYDVEVVDART